MHFYSAEERAGKKPPRGWLLQNVSTILFVQTTYLMVKFTPRPSFNPVIQNVVKFWAFIKKIVKILFPCIRFQQRPMLFIFLKFGIIYYDLLRKFWDKYSTA
jgi:hypothetical protein